MNEEYPLMAFIANEGVAPKGERYDRSSLVTDTENKLYKRTEFGDFIYSSNNLETGSIGLNKYGKACISPVYSVFHPTGIADSNFLGRRLVRKDFINSMVKWRQGVIYGQWRIHESDFLKIDIPVPSVEEQIQIGTFLDYLDNLITLHQRNSADFVSRFFSDFTNTWEQRKLGKHSEIVAGGTPNTAHSEYWNPKEIPWMSSGEINKKVIYTTDNMISKIGFSNSSAKWVKEKSVLIALAGQGKTRGTVAITEISLTTNQSIAAIQPDDSLYYKYLFQNLKGRYDELRNISSGDGTRGGLNKQIISDLIVLAPDMNEQRKIGDFLCNLDNLITLHQCEYIFEK